MALTLHTLSGSPFGWKVQLALKHLTVPHELALLSPDRGDTRQPCFLALNPHGKLPVIVDGDLVLYESDVIVEYLEDAYRKSAPSLWPAGTAGRALARRIAAEVSAYLYPPVRMLVSRWVSRPEPELGRPELEQVKQAIARFLEAFANVTPDAFVASDRPGAADYAMYPFVALLRRLDSRRPGEALTALIPAPLLRWARRVEALPYFERTYPPHWRSSP